MVGDGLLPEGALGGGELGAFVVLVPEVVCVWSVGVVVCNVSPVEAVAVV